ncbi:uncharacterized protein GlcG (DUF336 family) [Hamadaea flava]|uniref:Heme-binding protein n=1 Tax=Hamadaea flava TaxID=1742688 RepID=A0ABV8M2Y9_9ACTN|nr:heme-binding protein [Hamadaea flava]MCP2324406.1 uncharacterized protein GlcG (DUF336 family) [Hamadaea flava]
MQISRRLALTVGAGALTAAGALGIALPASTAAAVTAVPAVSVRSTVEVRTLTDDAVLRAAQAALSAATKDGQKVSVVVMDRSGVVRLALHSTGAGPQTDESAERKAFTAVSFGQPTSALAGRAGGTGPSIRDIPGTLFLGGGVPVVVDGTPIAAIGVGGAPSGDLDEKYAAAGAAALR